MVLIAGAGPVGLTTSLFLALWGVRSVVLDRLPRREVGGSRAICMQRDVLDALHRVGCGAALADEGVTWTVGRTYYREHELFTVTFPESRGGGFPPWVNVPQNSTEQRLAEQVERTDLVDVRYSHTVTGLWQDERGVRVQVDTPLGPRTLAGRYLIGADGARSTVRGVTGIEFPGRSFQDRFLICDIRADLGFPRERRFYFDPEWNRGRQVLLHPCPDSVWRIDWQVPVDYDLAAEQESGALDDRIRRIAGDTPYEVVWLSVYRFSERAASRFRTRRVFLAGDSAHLFAPFGARGMNSGMQDAENLAWKLGFVLRGWVGGRAAEALLDSYDTERRAAATENLRVTNATMEFLVPQTDAQWAWRRSVLTRAVNDPLAHELIDSGKLAEPYWYLDSPLTTPSPWLDPFPVQPGEPRPPIAGVLCPDGPCRVAGRSEVTRVRELFGAGFVVLTARPPQAQACAAVADAVPGPVEVHALGEIDPTGDLAQAMWAGPDSVHVVRPDGHLAAVLPEFRVDVVAAALRRACALPEGR